MEDLKPITRKELILSGEDIEPVTRIEYFMKKAMSGGGGSSLPQVTSDDNGDVLAVVDGEWAKAPAPSSLPPYTSADIGKVLTVGEAVAGTVVVIPEQTVTTDSEGAATLIGVDYSNLVSGQSVSVTMSSGGQSSTEDMYYNDNGLYFDATFSGDPVIEGSVLYVSQNIELTISANYAEYMPELTWDEIIPAIPADDGDYVLRIRDGVASWYGAQ